MPHLQPKPTTSEPLYSVQPPNASKKAGDRKHAAEAHLAARSGCQLLRVWQIYIPNRLPPNHYKQFNSPALPQRKWMLALKSVNGRIPKTWYLSTTRFWRFHICQAKNSKHFRCVDGRSSKTSYLSTREFSRLQICRQQNSEDFKSLAGRILKTSDLSTGEL